MAKKRIAVLMAALLALSFLLCACGDQEPSAESPSAGESDTAQVNTDTVSPSESGSESVDGSGASESPSESPSESASPEESASSSPSESASKDPNLKKFDGYLVDARCGGKDEDTHGHDLTKEPMKHTVECLKERAKYGYGMYIAASKGVFKFYKFDDDGNQMIKRYIVDKTTKTDNMRVAVRGVLDGDTIKVETVLKYGLE